MVKIPKKILEISPDLTAWPESWEGVPEDVPVGKKILHELIPFLSWIADQGYTKRTTRQHFDNIWALGGQLITDLQWEDAPLELDFSHVVASAVHEEGGPLLHTSMGDVKEDESFDATCRKLHKFLSQSTR